MNCPDNILVGNGIYDDTDAIQALLDSGEIGRAHV